MLRPKSSQPLFTEGRHFFCRRCNNLNLSDNQGSNTKLRHTNNEKIMKEHCLDIFLLSFILLLKINKSTVLILV